MIANDRKRLVTWDVLALLTPRLGLEEIYPGTFSKTWALCSFIFHACWQWIEENKCDCKKLKKNSTCIFFSWDKIACKKSRISLKTHQICVKCLESAKNAQDWFKHTFWPRISTEWQEKSTNVFTVFALLILQLPRKGLAAALLKNISSFENVTWCDMIFSSIWYPVDVQKVVQLHRQNLFLN